MRAEIASAGLGGAPRGQWSVWAVIARSARARAFQRRGIACCRAPGCSGCGAVLIDDSAARGASFDPSGQLDRYRGFGVVGGCLVEAAVGAVRVVVLEVLVEESAELVLVPDQCSVEEFVADGSNPALGERVGVRRTWWGGDHVGAGSGEDVVEGSGELASAIADHEPCVRVSRSVGPWRAVCGRRLS